MRKVKYPKVPRNNPLTDYFNSLMDGIIPKAKPKGRMFGKRDKDFPI